MILWDVDGRQSLATLNVHKGAVYGVAFSPDGQWLASASGDHTVILWSVDGRSPLARLDAPQEAVYDVAFSPGGKQLASASEDGTVILWGLELDEFMADACRTANRNLTCEEWRDYVSADKPYRKTCEALPGPERCE